MQQDYERKRRNYVLHDLFTITAGRAGCEVHKVIFTFTQPLPLPLPTPKQTAQLIKRSWKLAKQDNENDSKPWTLQFTHGSW